MTTHGGFLILMLFLWIVPTYLVYVHAKNRGRDAGLWAAVVLVAGLVGILLYFLLAGSSGRQPNTYEQRGTGAGGGQQAPGGWNSQQPQGNQNQSHTQNSSVVCQQCGATNDHLANFCSNCGESIR